MSVIIRNQAIIHYEALGRGRSVVFLHTWIGSWRYWAPAMQIAATSYRAYAVDFFGFGESSHEAALYTLRSQVDLLDGFLDEMGVERTALVAHGLGAWIAFALAAKRPERVARLLAVAAPLNVAFLDPRFRAASSRDLIAWLSPREQPAAELLSDASKADPDAPPMLIDSVTPEDPLVVGTKGIPLVLVYGSDDPSVQTPPSEHALLQDPFVYCVTLEGSGHFPMLDAPDRFHRLLTEYLALDDGLSPRELLLREEWRRRLR